MGVKALQEQLSAAVLMKAGSSEPALISFNTALPMCLPGKMRLHRVFEEIWIQIIQLNPGEAGNPRGKTSAAAHGKAPLLSSAKGQGASPASKHFPEASRMLECLLEAAQL